LFSSRIAARLLYAYVAVLSEVTSIVRIPGSVAEGSEIARTGIKKTNEIIKAVSQAVFPWKIT
jgi:hypothetical protein